MRSYTPYMAAADWALVRPLVLDCVLPIPVGSEEGARRLLRPLAHLAQWAHTAASLPLDRDILLDTDTINQFIATLPTSKARTYQGALFTIARAHGGDNTDRAFKYGTRVEAPYTEGELGSMASFVSSLTRPADIRTANAAMGVCGGAGIRRSELLTLRRRDLTATRSGWSVSVGGTWPRTVPVLDQWGTYIDRATDGVDNPDELIVPSAKARAGDFRLQRMFRLARKGATVTPHCARLRTTWVMKMVNLVSVGDLQHIAGYSSTDFLKPYEPYLNRRPDSVLEPILRGAETAANR